MKHDPLCLADPATDNSRCHYCVLIAKVRADAGKQAIRDCIAAVGEGRITIECRWADGYETAYSEVHAALRALLEVEP